MTTSAKQPDFSDQARIAMINTATYNLLKSIALLENALNTPTISKTDRCVLEKAVLDLKFIYAGVRGFASRDGSEFAELLNQMREKLL